MNGQAMTRGLVTPQQSPKGDGIYHSLVLRWAMVHTSTTVQETFSFQSYTKLMAFDGSADWCPHTALVTLGRPQIGGENGTKGKVRSKHYMHPLVSFGGWIWPEVGLAQFWMRHSWKLGITWGRSEGLVWFCIMDDKFMAFVLMCPTPGFMTDLSNWWQQSFPLIFLKPSPPGSLYQLMGLEESYLYFPSLFWILETDWT